MSNLTDAILPDSPYKGFVPFLEKDAPFFFGRDTETEIISANLRTERLTLIYGPTAVGKSSLLKAGVVTALQEVNKELKHAYADLLVEVPALSHINFADTILAPKKVTQDDQRPLTVVVLGKWVDDPLISLKAAIVKGVQESLPKIFPPDTTSDLLAVSLPKMLKDITSHREVMELLIILDQFEEFFVYHASGAIADSFAEEFSRAVCDPASRVNFLISIREDWLARLDRFKARIPYLFDHCIRINHLDRIDAEKAIRKPIEKYNKLIDPNAEAPDLTPGQVILNPDFTTEVLRQLESIENAHETAPKDLALAKESEAGQPHIHASQLQIVMQYLWEKVKNDSRPKLNLALVPKSDTVKRIIESHIHQRLDRLTRKEKLLAADLLRFLITPSGTKLADTAQDLGDRTGHAVKKIETLLDKLSEQDFRILNTITPPPGASNHLRYELTSDALAAPILDWVRDIRAKQHRSRVRLTYFGLFAVVLIIALVLAAFLRARQQRQTANEQRRIVEEERAKVQRAFDAWRRLDDQIPYSKAVLRAHGDKVTSAVFTPSGDILTASADGTAILWDVEKKKPRQYFGQNEKGLISAAISPVGDRVVTASEDGSVTLWRIGSTEKLELRGRTDHKITGISFNAKGDVIAVADDSGALTIWTTETGNVIKELGNGKAVHQLVFSPKGELLAGTSDDNTVRIWTTSDWTQRNSLIGHTDQINSLAFSPDEKLIAAGSADATARIWDLSTGKLRQTLSGHQKSINNVDFNHDGKLLLTASDDTTACIWSLDTGKPTTLIGHTDRVLSASFSPDSSRVVTAGADGVVRIWSVSTGKSLAELRGHIDQVTYVSYSADGKYVLSAGDDSTARVWLADESGNFDVDQPIISALPPNYVGECPVTIRFVVNFTVSKGRGKIAYRFKGSDGRIWPPRESVFDGPGTTYVNWYWKITENYTGSETIEIMQPKGIKEQKAKFTVACTNGGTTKPEVIASAAP